MDWLEWVIVGCAIGIVVVIICWIIDVRVSKKKDMVYWYSLIVDKIQEKGSSAYDPKEVERLYNYIEKIGSHELAVSVMETIKFARDFEVVAEHAYASVRNPALRLPEDTALSEAGEELYKTLNGMLTKKKCLAEVLVSATSLKKVDEIVTKHKEKYYVPWVDIGNEEQ